jgi:hypothetical protein
VVDLQVAVDEHRCPRPERSLGNPAIARDHVSGEDAVRDEPLALVIEARRELDHALTGPWRQRSVVQHPDSCTRCSPRRRRRGRRLAEVAERRPGESGEREHGRFPPQHIRSRDRRQSHCLDLDLGARLISVNFKEQFTDTQGRTLVVGGDNFNLCLFHVGHYCGMTIDVA